MTASAVLVGNITNEPELRFTNTGRAVCGFGVASNRRWQNRTTQEWEESTSFFNVTVWGDMGENVAQSLRKGDRILASGRFEQRSYVPDESKPDEKRSVVDFIADEIGASLRWATSTVTKNPREGAPPADLAPAGAQNGEALVGAGAPVISAPSYTTDEEPF